MTSRTKGHEYEKTVTQFLKEMKGFLSIFWVTVF